MFGDAKALTDFIEKGWDASAGATAGAGAGGSAANVKAGGGELTGGKQYALWTGARELSARRPA